MLAQHTSTWTATPGSDTTVCTPFHSPVRPEETGNIPGGIADYAAYLVHFNSLRGKVGGHYRTFKKIEALKKSLEKTHTGQVDPIRFLMHLYFHDMLSLADILVRAGPMGLRYRDTSGLGKLFTDVFRWRLREKSEERNRHTIKQRQADRKRAETLALSNGSRLEEKIQGFHAALSAILEDKQEKEAPSGFDCAAFGAIRHNSDRIVYLLEHRERISPEDIRRIYAGGTGTRIIARALGEKIDRICGELGLSPMPVHPSTITRIMEKSLSQNPTDSPG